MDQTWGMKGGQEGQLTETGKTVGGAGFGENITNLVLYVLSLRGVFDVQVEILTGQLNGRI